jgi:uncharacterized membrane protein
VTTSRRRALARHWLVVAALTVCVALATSWRLSAPSLWLDEGSTWAISGHSFSDLLRALWHSEADAGALYLVIEHAWLAVWGASVVALRSLSVVFAVLTVPLFFGLARRLLSRSDARVGLTMSWRSPRLELLRRVIRHDPLHTVARIFPGIVVYRYAPARTF